MLNRACCNTSSFLEAFLISNHSLLRNLKAEYVLMLSVATTDGEANASGRKTWVSYFSGYVCRKTKFFFCVWYCVCCYARSTLCNLFSLRFILSFETTKLFIQCFSAHVNAFSNKSVILSFVPLKSLLHVVKIVIVLFNRNHQDVSVMTGMSIIFLVLCLYENEISFLIQTYVLHRKKFILVRLVHSESVCF